MRKLKLKITLKMRKRDSFKENNDVDYNADEYGDIGKVREDWTSRCGKRGLMRKMKLKIIVKMRKRDSFKDNNDVDYNDDEHE